MSKIELTGFTKVYIWMVSCVQGILMMVVLSIILEQARIPRGWLWVVLLSICLSLSIAGSIWCAASLHTAVVDTIIHDRRAEVDPPTPLKADQIVPLYRRGVRIAGHYFIRVGGRTMFVKVVDGGIDEGEDDVVQ